MFGESESESPRVPSPWDTLIASSPPSRSSSSSSPSGSDSVVGRTNPNHSIHAILPRLVPEADVGNVEYKLQLLSPSPARFARLVTQLKWRLLEGGGQAYYELGVADSGALVGLSRTEMEMSLETLEMMAGEIGASVVVVKEIEVPEALVVAVKAQQAAGLLLGEEKWARTRRRSRKGVCGDGSGDETANSTETMATEMTDVEGEFEEEEDLSATVMLCRPASTKSSGSDHSPIFAMDPELETDPAEKADGEQEHEPDIPSIAIELEISSVFKPRPVRTRVHSAYLMNQAAKNKRQKKHYKAFQQDGEEQVESTKKGGRQRRQHKNRKRDPASTVKETDALVLKLESLHVSLEINEGVGMTTPAKVEPQSTLHTDAAAVDDDDVFPSISTKVNRVGEVITGSKRIIVEALVVRKMSLEEAFLDFGAFS